METFSCPQCGKFFGSKENLNVHIGIHTEEKPFACQQCKSSFASEAHLAIHQRFHDEEKPFKCLHCFKCFKCKENLESHARVHTGEKPYICPQCGKDFTFKGNLKVHLRIHTGEKPFSCPQCEKKFGSSKDMRSHLKFHSGEYVFACCVCEKGFPNKRTLRYHQRIHAKEKQPDCGEDVKDCSCLLCGESLSRNPKARSSSGCVEVFSDDEDFTQIHTEDKPDRDPHCEKNVPAAEILKAHESCQTGEKKHPCVSCGMNFNTSIYLLAHVKKGCPKLSS